MRCGRRQRRSRLVHRAHLRLQDGTASTRPSGVRAGVDRVAPAARFPPHSITENAARRSRSRSGRTSAGVREQHLVRHSRRGELTSVTPCFGFRSAETWPLRSAVGHLALVSLVMIVAGLPIEWARAALPRIDRPGCTVIAGALLAFLYASRSRAPFTGIVATVATALAMTMFSGSYPSISIHAIVQISVVFLLLPQHPLEFERTFRRESAARRHCRDLVARHSHLDVEPAAEQLRVLVHRGRRGLPRLQPLSRPCVSHPRLCLARGGLLRARSLAVAQRLGRSNGTARQPRAVRPSE
jgi:hypothetical protein